MYRGLTGKRKSEFGMNIAPLGGGNNSDYSKQMRKTERKVGRESQEEAQAVSDKHRQLLHVFMKTMGDGTKTR